MQTEEERLEAIVARSNLLPTAGEFVPRSQLRAVDNAITNENTTLRMYSKEGAALSSFNASSSSSLPTTSNCSGEVTDYYQNKNSHSSTSQQRMENGFENNSRFQNNSNEYFSKNREPKYAKNKKGNDRWKRTDKEFVKSDNGLRNQATDKVSVTSQGRVVNDFSHYNGESSSSGRRPKQNKFHNENFNDRYQGGYSDNGRVKYYNMNVQPFDKNGTTYYKSKHWNQGGYREAAGSAGPSGSLDEYQPYSTGRGRLPRHGSDERDDARPRPSASQRPKPQFQSNSRHEKPFLVGEDGESASGKPKSTVSYKMKPRSGAELGESGARSQGDLSLKTNQRERLIDLLTRGGLECLVCCGHVHQTQPTWSCGNCYHVLHLKCIMKWARSSKGDDGWRCPACQHVTVHVPSDYLCFCGKATDPEWNRNDCPHSCGEVCGKNRPNPACSHRCVLLCHPGPCPPCLANVTKACGCGKTSTTAQCSVGQDLVCDGDCSKPLTCQVHTCQAGCHSGPCAPCQVPVHQECFCGKLKKEVVCSVETHGVETFCCGEACGKQLSCGNHSCGLVCHEGPCGDCTLSPAATLTCPCGRNSVADLLAGEGRERTSCLDPVPKCDLICGKLLICGQPGDRHKCQEKCHEGDCAPCPLTTVVKCRCGHMDKTLPCAKLTTRADDARCDKRCSKKRSCGKHKCNQECCIELDHECSLPCSRMLGCGLHRCEALCHRGHCMPCYQASFEELLCECGSQVLFPPVPCGTKRPPCTEPCSREHPCEHPPTHSCHSAQHCPPCTHLTQKHCHGKHELRKAVPCHQETFSCGRPCGNDLPCGRHRCILPCHSAPCLRPGQQCSQPCAAPRALCGHACGAPCHEGTCPDAPCKEVVRVTCECGNRFTSRLCHDNATEFRRIATVQLASKMADLQAGQTIDLNDVASATKKLSYKTLECNEECRQLERNRRLAIALQIRNPDLSAKLTPRYSETMREFAKKEPWFCQMVHDRLTELVQLAKQSKQKSRSYSFDPMNRKKRHFIHECCEHFGCESVAYDAEPKRNVVATALKEKSWLPSMSLLEVVQRESGVARKVPLPLNNTKLTTLSSAAPQRSMDVLPSKVLSAWSSQVPDSAEGPGACGGAVWGGVPSPSYPPLDS